MKQISLSLLPLFIVYSLISQDQPVTTDQYGHTTGTTHPMELFLPTDDPGNEWISVGPFGGDVFDIAIDPVNPDHVFLAANYPYMRTSSEDPWQVIEPLLSLSPGGIHAVEANDAGVLFAGGQTTFNKIFRSEDQGMSWQQSFLGANAGVLSITIDPSDNMIMYATTNSNISGTQNKVIIQSVDGGVSWTAFDMTNWFPLGMACIDLAVDPDNSDVLVALGDGGFSFPAKAIISLDGGTSWQDITAGLTTGVPFNEVTIWDGSIYVCGGQLFGGQTMGIWKSDDYGETWLDISFGFPIKVVNDLLIDPTDPDLMYAATEGDGVYYSTNGGLTWNYDTGGAGNNGSARKIIFDPTDPAIIYGGFLSLGVCTSDNSGLDWTSSSVGIASLKLNDIEIDPNNPEIILASFEAENSGGCYLFDPVLGDWALVDALPGTRFSAVSVGIDGRMYAWSNGPTTVAAEGVYRSSDGGATWENMGPNVGPVFETQIFAMTLSETDPDLIFIAGNNFGANGWASMIYRSHDAGGAWENVYMGPENDGFRYIYIDPTSDDQIVYAAYKSESSGAGFMKSLDGGDNWEPINEGIEPATKWGSAIICDPDDPFILYGGAGGYGGTPGTVYRSGDGGASWNAMNISTSNFSKISDLMLSPLNPDVLYAATTQNGVYITEDGENWAVSNDGLLATNITGFSRLFENEEGNPAFYASSFSNSAFYTEVYEPGTIGIGDQIRPDARMRIHPVPASDRVEITMKGYENKTMDCTLCDIQGKNIASYRLVFDHSGKATLSLDLDQGIYLMVLTKQKEKIVKKLIVE